MAYGQTAQPSNRYRPVQPMQPPGPPQMAGDVPQNDMSPTALPLRPPKGQTFGVGKAQGGDGPAFDPGYQDQPVTPYQTPRPQYLPPVPTGRAVRPLQPTTPITPTTSPVGSNLRGEIYTPGNDPRLIGAQGRTDAAANAVAGMNRGVMQTGNEGRYRSVFGDGQVTGTMDALNGAPDRTALALQKLKDFDAASNEQRFNEERSLGRNIAKFGRTGLQANADNFGEITRRIAGDRGRLANELAYNVADADTNDRFRKVELNTGLAERNADRGFDRARAAVDTATGQTDRGIGDQFDQLTAANSLEDRIFGQGQSNRSEYRTERENQNRDAQQTIENRIREMEAQQAAEEMRLRRSMYQAQAGGL